MHVYFRRFDEQKQFDWYANRQETLRTLFERNVQLKRNLRFYCDGVRCDDLPELEDRFLQSVISYYRAGILNVDLGLLPRDPDKYKLENMKRLVWFWRLPEYELLMGLSAQCTEYLARSIDSVEMWNDSPGEIDSILESAFQDDGPSFLKLKALFEYASFLLFGLIVSGIVIELVFRI